VIYVENNIRSGGEVEVMIEVLPAKTALVLAPMEGVLDAPMRAVVAEIGGFDFAVSEFIRVSQAPVPARTIRKAVPELSNRAPLGRVVLPIQVQLLGSDPHLLGETAIEACSAGASAIDLNFGCPSPTVIRNDGGSALLRQPLRIHRIIAEVRKRLPRMIMVSAKIRLGWERPDEVHEIARAIQESGADWLTIHARTRAQLYRPGVRWDEVAKVARASAIPVIANGDLFSTEDLERCRTLTGCRHFMVGRGVLLDPWIGKRFSGFLSHQRLEKSAAPDDSGTVLGGMLQAIRRFIEIAEPFSQNSGYVPSRVKQWLGIVDHLHQTLGQTLDPPLGPQRLPASFRNAIARARSTPELLEELSRAEEFSDPP